MSASTSLGVDIACKNISIRISGETEKKIVEVCTNREETFFYSKLCRTHCDILERFMKSKKIRPFPNAGIGTPNSHYCHEVGGKPYFIEIFESPNAGSSSDKICISEKDQSFISENLIQPLIKNSNLLGK